MFGCSKYFCGGGFWNVVNCLYSSVVGWVENTYWLGLIVDDIFDLTPISLIQISAWGLLVGGFVGGFAAIGEAVSKKTLNVGTQEGSTQIQNMSFCQQFRSLKHWQRLLLAGSLVDNVGAYAAPLTFIVTIMTRNELQRPYNFITDLGAAAIAFFPSVADMKGRVASFAKQNTMQVENKDERDPLIP